MFRFTVKGRTAARPGPVLAGLVLVGLLALPALAGGGSGGGGFDLWGWLAGLADRWAGWEKEGPCIDPAGRPCTPGTAPLPSTGRNPSANKEGPCITSDGKPVCTPGAVVTPPGNRQPQATQHGNSVLPGAKALSGG